MFTRLLAFTVVALLLAPSAQSQNVPAPPAWQDGQGTSVYLEPNAAPPAASTPTTTETNAARYAVANSTNGTPAPPPTALPPSPRTDMAVKPAALEVPAVESDAPSRRLAPPSAARERDTTTADGHATSTRHKMDFGLPTQSIYTVITGLAIVIGAFLLFAWALKKGGNASNKRRGMLPNDAVSVLGRVPLAARQFAELLRVGNKLVLVALTPSGPTTLTEVTDPVEVDRLVGLCQQSESTSTTKAFEHVFQQMTNEPTTSGFLGDESVPMSLSAAASAYRSHRGTARV